MKIDEIKKQLALKKDTLIQHLEPSIEGKIDLRQEIMSLPFDPLQLTSMQKVFIEQLCKHMDVKKQLFISYDKNFKKTASDEKLSIIWTLYLLDLISFYAYVLHDLKYLNTVIKYLEINNLMSKCIFVSYFINALLNNKVTSP